MSIGNTSIVDSGFDNTYLKIMFFLNILFMPKMYQQYFVQNFTLQ